MRLLGDLCNFQAGSAFPQSEQGAKYGDFPFAKVRDLASMAGSEWTVVSNWISEVQRSSLNARLVPKGSIVFAKIGEGLRRERFAVASSDMFIDNNLMAAVPVDSIVDPRWLYYKFHTLGLSDYAVGSAMPYLKQSDLSAIAVSVPERSQQQGIAELLGSLDDKIAANFRSASLSMDLAQGLVAARPAGVATTLGDISSTITRGIAPKYSTHGELILNQKCIRGGRVDASLARRHSTIVRDIRKRVQPGDIFVNSTGQGTLGRVASWSLPLDQVTVDSHVSIVRIDPSLADPAFVAALLLCRESDIEALAEGTTGQTELRREALGALPICLPDLDTQRSVGDTLRGLVGLMDRLDEENDYLAATRDELLPLLMSGKITVKDAEKTVEEVV